MRVAGERLTGQRIDHDRARAGEVAGPRRQRRAPSSTNRPASVEWLPAVVQEEGRARAAVEDVRDRQRTAERRAVALLDVVGLLTHAAVERIRLRRRTSSRRGCSWRCPGYVRRRACRRTRRDRRRSPPGPPPRPPPPAAATAEPALLAPATEAAFAAAAESVGSALAELAAAAAASAKQQRVVRLSLDAGGRNRLGRRVGRKSRRQLELGPEGRRCVVIGRRRG